MTCVDLALVFALGTMALVCLEGWEDVQRYRRCRRANKALEADRNRRLWRL